MNPARPLAGKHRKSANLELSNNWASPFAVISGNGTIPQCSSFHAVAQLPREHGFLSRPNEETPMSEEFACPTCRRQSVIYPDAREDDARVVCRTCGTSFGTLSQFRRFVERFTQGAGAGTSRR
jgi:transposase-like protein